jgi:hypothetical protein
MTTPPSPREQDQEWLKHFRVMDAKVDDFCRSIDARIDNLEFPFTMDASLLSGRSFAVPIMNRIMEVHLAQYNTETVEFKATLAETNPPALVLWTVDFHEIVPNRQADIVLWKVQRVRLASRLAAGSRSGRKRDNAPPRVDTRDAPVQIPEPPQRTTTRITTALPPDPTRGRVTAFPVPNNMPRTFPPPFPPATVTWVNGSPVLVPSEPIRQCSASGGGPCTTLFCRNHLGNTINRPSESPFGRTRPVHPMTPEVPSRNLPSSTNRSGGTVFSCNEY